MFSQISVRCEEIDEKDWKIVLEFFSWLFIQFDQTKFSSEQWWVYVQFYEWLYNTMLKSKKMACLMIAWK